MPGKRQDDLAIARLQNSRHPGKITYGEELAIA